MTQQETKEFSCGSGRQLPGTACNGFELQFADTQFTHTTPAGTSMTDGWRRLVETPGRTEGYFLFICDTTSCSGQTVVHGVSEW